MQIAHLIHLLSYGLKAKGSEINEDSEELERLEFEVVGKNSNNS